MLWKLLKLLARPDPEPEPMTWTLLHEQEEAQPAQAK